MAIKKQTASWGRLFFGLNGLRLLAMCGGVALYAVNVNVMATLLPSIVKDLGGIELYSWATSLFIAASILSVALSASIIDFSGLRGAFLLALFIFLLGSIGSALSVNIYALLGARVVQGLGGGLLLGLSYSAIRMVFLERYWLRATAVLTSMWGVAALAGPAIGGMFAQTGQWRLAFITIIPIALVVAVLVMLGLKSRPEERYQQRLNVPIFKALLLVWSLLVMMLSGAMGSWLLVGLAVVITVTILFAISRDDEGGAIMPLFPNGSYDFSAPLACMYAGIGLMCMALSSSFFVPYFLENIHGIEPMWAGYMTALTPAGWAFGALATVKSSPRSANKLFIIGPLLSAVGLALLGVFLPWQTLNTDLAAFVPLLQWLSLGAELDLFLLFISLLAVGFGLGVIWPHIVTRVFTYAPPGQENTASAAIITLQLYAVGVGVTVGGLITNDVGLDISLAYTQLAARLLFMGFALLPILYVLMSKAGRQVTA